MGPGRRSLVLLLLAACEPLEVRFPGDPLPEPSADVHDWPVDPHLVPEVTTSSRARPCANPGAREASGPFARFESDTPPSGPENWLWAGGIIAGDLDGDGYLELIAPAEPYAKVYQGRPDGPPIERDVLAGFDLSYGIGGSVADFDGDGDLDILILRYDRPAVLIRNDGHGVFTDVTVASGLHAVGPNMASTWADYDRDGDLDLFIAGYGHRFDGPAAQAAPSWLFENQGDGTFVDRSHLLPPEVHAGFTMAAGFHDVNRDGWPDLYLVNDIGAVDPNLLLLNVGGELLLDRHTHGLDLHTSGTGLGAGDLNGDGLPDFIIPHWHQVSVMLSDRDRLTWVDHAQALGVNADLGRKQAVGWGAELVDLDNDGDLDGLVAYGHMAVSAPGWANPELQPDALYLNEGGAFRDVGVEWGLDDDGAQRGFAVADFNDDGWLDIAKRDLDGPNVLYISRCGDQRWVRVNLRSPGPNAFGIGARVAVTSAQGQVQEQIIRAGGTGFGYGGPPEAHFGLGPSDTIRRIDVLWPDGMRTRLEDLAPDQVLTITRLE